MIFEVVCYITWGDPECTYLLGGRYKGVCLYTSCMTLDCLTKQYTV